MNHTIRQHGQLTQIDCELGSGYCDDNGNEIFEGDCVQVSFVGFTWYDRAHFKNGAIYIGAHLLADILSYRLEIDND